MVEGNMKAKPAKKMTKKKAKPQRTLKEIHAWMNEHWDEVMAKAKANTKRLTGREVL